MRGAHPTLKNYRFLRRLRLKTIISLMAEEPTPDLVEYCGAEGVNLVYRRAEKYDDGEVLSMSLDLVAEIINLLLDKANHPIYLHCRDGGHNTGLIIMCLRRLQHWTNEAIHDEHRRYTKGNEIHYQEEQFVQSFPGPITIPASLPPWLWGGLRIRTHPSVKIIYSPSAIPEPHDPPSRAAAAMKQYLQSLGSDGDDGSDALASSDSLANASPESTLNYQRLLHEGVSAGLARREARPSNASDEYRALTVGTSPRFPSSGDGARPRGGGGDDGEGERSGSGGGLGDGLVGPSESGALSEFFGTSGSRTSAGLRAESGGGGDMRDGEDDYQGWPSMANAVASYDVGTAGLALAGLDLAAPVRKAAAGRHGRPAQRPSSAAFVSEQNEDPRSGS